MGNIFIDGIEKVINEHGSAPILKERLLLAADQYAALEKKVIELTERCRLLEQKISASETENTNLEGQIMQLNEKIRNIEEKDIIKINRYLPKEQEDILNIICYNHDISDLKIILMTKQNTQAYKYHIEKLLKLGFINFKPNYKSISDKNPSISYTITQNGREYLFKNGLLK
jgi:hypothetical protein